MFSTLHYNAKEICCGKGIDKFNLYLNKLGIWTPKDTKELDRSDKNDPVVQLFDKILEQDIYPKVDLKKHGDFNKWKTARDAHIVKHSDDTYELQSWSKINTTKFTISSKKD